MYYKITYETKFKAKKKNNKNNTQTKSSFNRASSRMWPMFGRLVSETFCNVVHHNHLKMKICCFIFKGMNWFKAVWRIYGTVLFIVRFIIVLFECAIAPPRRRFTMYTKTKQKKKNGVLLIFKPHLNGCWWWQTDYDDGTFTFRFFIFAFQQWWSRRNDWYESRWTMPWDSNWN